MAATSHSFSGNSVAGISGKTVWATMDTGTTGVKTSYTCPTGKYARVTLTTAVITGTPTYQWRVTRGASTYLIRGGLTTSIFLAAAFIMEPGDVLDCNISSLSAGTTDAGIHIEEVPDQA